MNDNPYSAPSASLDVPEDPIEIPATVLSSIKNAWIAGLVSATLTLAMTVYAIYGTSVLGASAWNLIDVALILGFSFGIYKKSRTSAVLMLVYFAGSKALMMYQQGVGGGGGILGIVFVILYWKGVTGTFEYHQYRSFAK
ncbi:MAG: hypothetical protein V4582_10485 [Pseudomonadota bacterium]